MLLIKAFNGYLQADQREFSVDRRGESRSVLVQPEMEKRRSPLVSIPPFGRGFSRHAGLSSDDSFWSSVCSAREEHPALLDIGSMSPPDYPSAWLHPCRARLRFARQDHCSSA